SNGGVSVSGTASSDILAVALLLYDTDGTTLLRMETVGVTLGDNENAFTGTISIPLSSGTYTIKAANYEGGSFSEVEFTVPITHVDEDEVNDDNNYDDTSSNSSFPETVVATPTPTPVVITPTPTPVPIYKAEVKTGTDPVENLAVVLDDTGEKAMTSLEQEDIQLLLGEAKEATISLPTIPNVTTYTLELPASALSKPTNDSTLSFSTGAGTLTISDNMLSTLSDMEDKKVGLSIGHGDKTSLSDKEREVVGNRPLIKLQMTVDGTQTKWNNPDAPVTLSISYTPSQQELENPDNIIVWYLDGTGNLVCIPDGKYDPDTGEITFTTTHFSLYAVGYNQVFFSDVAVNAWYQKAVEFIAAREITKGTGADKFSPEALLTRGEFIVLLMRAYGIEPDDKPSDNFADAGNTYYTGYLAEAKRRGISNGVGNNLYAPEQAITRQEMFTLLYNSLKVINRLPQDSSAKTLLSFADGGSVAPWAEEAMSYLVKSGTISGSNGKLHPENTSSRAEMAQVLYNLLSKQ
ncbi:MAG: S-layer homology domain-containing protein, partial [Ruminiclostridium sp.]|nr:S-layer homology domain-containing protein [Ruminiclostridium sp.]